MKTGFYYNSSTADGIGSDPQMNCQAFVHDEEEHGDDKDDVVLDVDVDVCEAVQYTRQLITL